MALVGTISGSNGTSNTAITGTLVIANTTANFPRIPGDATLFVSGGLDGTGRTVIGSDLIVSGTLKSLFSAGAEGGEVFLTGAQTSTIANGITIDVYNNSLRIFEAGGTNRGGYFDITALAAGVATNLASGGPSGANTYVQFNDGGSFGGSSDFEFDKINGIVTAATLVATGTGNSLVSSGSVLVKDSGGNTTVTLANNGEITGSNLRLTGDIAVVGGDLTTTAATFNLVTGASAVRIGSNPVNVMVSGTFDGSGSANTSVIRVTGGNINIGSTSKFLAGGSGQLTIFNDASNGAIENTLGHLTISTKQPSADKRLELVFSGSGPAAMTRIRRLTGTSGTTLTELFEVRGDGTILIGSASTGASFLGNTTISNDLFLSSGRIAVNTDTTPIELVSSGNVLVKLDANNNAVGHFFAVQNYLGTNQFLVGENGNSEISGTLVVSGNNISTVTTTTFNLLNNALTGTLNIGGATQTINFGSPTNTGSMQGDFTVGNRSTLGGIIERMVHTQGGSSLTCNMIGQSIFYLNGPSGAVTANFTNVPTTVDRIHTPTVILSQSATPQIVGTVQIDGAGQTINWANGVTPTGNASKQDVFGFSLIRSGSAWKVLGQMSTYG